MADVDSSNGVTPEPSSQGTPDNNQQATISAPNDGANSGAGQQQQVDAQELQQKLQQAEAQRAQLETNYKQLQADHTRKSQALAQLAGGTGQQQQNDPLAGHVDALVKKGYDAKQARDLTEMAYGMMAPLQQELQSNITSLRNQNMVGDVMQQAFQQRPELFSDPEVAEKIQQRVREYAQQDGRYLSPEYVLNVGYQEFGAKHFAGQNGTTPTQTGSGNGVGLTFNSMNGPVGQYSPRPQAITTKPLTPYQQQLQEQIDARYPKK